MLFRSEITFGSDGDFSLSALKSRINADLSNDLGNLCQRSLTMIVKYCDSIVPGHENINDADKKFLSKISNDLDELSNLIDNQEINIYIRKIWDIISDANKYFNDYKPWELKDSNKLAFNNVLYVTADIIKQIGVMIYPIMPNTSEKILDFFNIEIDQISFELLNTNVAKVKIDHIKPLFPRVE